ncbi:hypothetical protein [Methylobacterium radiotolerans]|uniref:hypothetical protein n=1 Tax=Methylobacterium radiotolerans TaxID=31998 RepID=UPI001F390700|nr:hypothetical protein [Methylobacterium radiotolerans]UIY44142.1 hypothetical protein LZ599_10835 [Methylobacterium radiotolerans]
MTEAAPPRVAGRPAKPGQTLALTELQARSELLAGAIVPKAADRKDDDPLPSGAFETTDELVQIQARAKGYKGAIVATAPAEAPIAPAADKVPARSDPVAQGMSAAAGAATSSSTAATAGDGKADAGATASDVGTASDSGKRPGKASAANTGA